jgi:hypothetical protein
MAPQPGFDPAIGHTCTLRRSRCWGGRKEHAPMAPSLWPWAIGRALASLGHRIALALSSLGEVLAVLGGARQWNGRSARLPLGSTARSDFGEGEVAAAPSARFRPPGASAARPARQSDALPPPHPGRRRPARPRGARGAPFPQAARLPR